MNTKNLSLSGNEKITMISNMYTMLSAGIPILETIDSLLQDAKGNQKKVLQTLREDLGQGQHVYFTFAKFPRIFDKVIVNIVKASEGAGTLDVTLKDLTGSIRREMEFNDKIKSALIYPSFILVVFVGVMMVILTVVVPKIATVFTRLNVELPLPTRIMIFLSEALINYPLYIAAGAIAIIAGIIFFYKKNRRMFVNIFISLPLISKMAREIDLTRFTRSLYLLLNAGIPITSALELTEDVVIKRDVHNAIVHAKTVVFAGKKLSEGLRDHKNVMLPMMIKIIEAGERSGSLDKSLQEISDYLDYQVSNSLKTITALVEPLLLVIIGLLVGGMMMAIIAPIYSVIGNLGAR
jgi:type II secretory pathway component PulF